MSITDASPLGRGDEDKVGWEVGGAVLLLGHRCDLFPRVNHAALQIA